MNDELIAKTPIGEIVVGIKSDHDYPGIFVELRGEHLNDRFKEGAVRLAWVEYGSTNTTFKIEFVETFFMGFEFFADSCSELFHSPVLALGDNVWLAIKNSGVIHGQLFLIDSSDKQCLQTIAYGDGNADDFTHLIEHEHILKTFE